jgi:hypothetical protein
VADEQATDELWTFWEDNIEHREVVEFDGDVAMGKLDGVAHVLVAVPDDLGAYLKLVGPTPAAITVDDDEDVARWVAGTEWSCFLAWRSLRRSGVIEKAVAFDDDFLDRLG